MNTPESLKARIGQEIGVSDWCLIDQDMINRFAALAGSGDHDPQVFLNPLLPDQVC